MKNPGADLTWLEGGFCAVDKASCNAIWWCSFPNWCLKTAMGVAAFSSLFYALAYVVYPLVEGLLKRIPSKFPDEDTRYWFAWHCVSVTHAALVCIFSAPPVYRLTGLPHNVILTTPHDPDSWAAVPDLASIADGAHIFMCFLLYDLIVICLYKLAKWDMLVHHAVFVLFTVVVMYNCFLGYAAGWLLLMEFSTIPLNYVSFFRNRLGYDHWSVKCMFGFFAVSFCYIRLFSLANHVLRPFFASLYDDSVRYDMSGVGGVPSWQLAFLSVGFVAAFLLQASWALGAILPKLRKLAGMREAEDSNGKQAGSNGAKSKKDE